MSGISCYLSNSRVEADQVVVRLVSTVDPTKLRVRVVFENGMSTDDHVSNLND
ncbi:hypothetical protein L917_06558 [Phytophthora nicotianae]|uniref:Uncharacterized protein n=1 Tax=Phytophthora nicotianae TaxID=4792 RepID=W2LG77_PHYNI|nr:hypothetical protein L915_06751 [Phytophthora nicotianae]ETL42508.1 hypothetical protein L916_06689 [Phytophthora nicotianae]ETL95679.1 hypothetical protein L917_06558 [Phytophthora nicotianae]